jgi:hypothetical protein
MSKDKNVLEKVIKKVVKPAAEVKEDYERTKRIKDQKENLEVVWKEKVDKDDYKAAADYLDLVIDDKKLVKSIIRKLKKAKLITKKAKDILRASSLDKLTADNIHVEHNINKYRMGIKLSPVLLVRGKNFSLIIADGYHRVCASYELSEDLNIPCKLVSI